MPCTNPENSGFDSPGREPWVGRYHPTKQNPEGGDIIGLYFSLLQSLNKYREIIVPRAHTLGYKKAFSLFSQKLTNSKTNKLKISI